MSWMTAAIGKQMTFTMTNRPLAYIVRDQKPLILAADESVGSACKLMRERGAGSVLVVDKMKRLSGIFTGRDAVRLLAKSKDASRTLLAKAMTRNPTTINPSHRAIDALRVMDEGGFRHVPVIDAAKIYGVVSRRDFKGMELEEFARQQAGNGGGGTLDRQLLDAIGRAKPCILSDSKTVQEACRSMRRRKCGGVLVIDKKGRLKGIFTGRDAVRVIAAGKDGDSLRLSSAMTKDLMTISPNCRAIEALRVMNDGGFRHLPVVENDKVLGVVTRGDFTGIEVDRLDEDEHLKECIW
jgi:CBS domain-containing protein